MLFQWRVKLRERIKMAKQAKVAEKYFVMKRAWKLLKAKTEERRRERKVREWEKARVKKVFGSEFSFPSLAPICQGRILSC